MFKEYLIKIPTLAKWDNSQPGNSQNIPWLGLVSLCQSWDFYWVFFKYPKISKMGIHYFFLCYMLMSTPLDKMTNKKVLLRCSKKVWYMEILTKPLLCAWNLFRKITIGTAKEMHLYVLLLIIILYLLFFAEEYKSITYNKYYFNLKFYFSN